MDVGKHRGGSDFHDHFSRGDEGEIGDNHFIPWSHVKGAQRKGQRVGPVAATHGLTRQIQGCAEFLLKCIDLLAADEARGGQHLVHGPVQFGT